MVSLAGETVVVGVMTVNSEDENTFVVGTTTVNSEDENTFDPVGEVEGLAEAVGEVGTTVEVCGVGVVETSETNVSDDTGTTLVIVACPEVVVIVIEVETSTVV